MSSEFWLGALAGAAGLQLAGRAWQHAGELRDHSRFPPPGRLYDGMHLRVQGHGSPTVVFEAGLAASSISWGCIQDQVAAYTRTVSYDRLGLGWSLTPSRPRSLRAMSAELSSALAAAGIHGPLVLVAHSFGGCLARCFAAAHPARVAAAVLVDPMEQCEFFPLHHCLDRQLRRGALFARFGAELCECGLLRFALESALKHSARLSRLASHSMNSNRRGSELSVNLLAELRKLPPSTWDVIKSHWCRPNSLRTVADYLDLIPSLCATPLDNSALRSIPLWIISTGATPPARLAGHRRTTAISRQGRHILAADSGHWVQFDAPALLLDTIRRAVGAAVSAPTSSTSPGETHPACRSA
jgi:pimeloyl-ACP methyl ester carboxylesterase